MHDPWPVRRPAAHTVCNCACNTLLSALRTAIDSAHTHLQGEDLGLCWLAIQHVACLLPQLLHGRCTRA